MSSWDAGIRSIRAAQNLVERWSQQENISSLKHTVQHAIDSALDANTFESIQGSEERLLALKNMDATTRSSVLRSMDAVERDQLLGGTAFDASLHHTGPAYTFDWDSFKPDSTEFNGANAHALSIASKRVYEPLEEVKKTYEAQGFEVKTFDRNGTQAFLAIKDDVALLSFRGTEPDEVTDLLTDAQVCLVDGPYGKVHKGFSKGLDAVWPDIQKELDAANVGQDKPLFITGHSLGAALGTLAAARLEKQGKAPQGLYTFGSPRVGNDAFAERFNRSTLGSRTWRFRNNNDGVTIIPPPGGPCDYTHVGSEVYLDNQGIAHDRPDASWIARDRRDSLFSPVQSYFLKKHMRGMKNDNNALEHLESMWDHGMTGYVKHVYVNQDLTIKPR